VAAEPAAKHDADAEGLSGLVLKRLGTEFVERHEREHGVADTDRVVAVARAGQSLAISPEGRLACAPGLRPFRMGAFVVVVAAEAGVPVVPVAIRGTRDMLRPEHHVPDEDRSISPLVNRSSLWAWAGPR
jgi:1-acyl-sn-glycerol-3-phosphate acyltransferase